MKKLINDPRHVVREMLEGLVDLHPGLALLEDETVVVRAGLPEPARRPVAVLSGGGAGHEPAHAGYVGPGLLAGAVSGDVFTSPSTDAVLAGIRACAGPAGAVLIVKNYTGDRLNFGLAAELARAEGIPTEVVVVADDVALRDRIDPARSRGIAGTVLVHKVAGAAAEAGLPVAGVAAAARGAAARLGTMGVALTPCIVPAVGRPGFTLGEEEIELGLGIHGEAGSQRATAQAADALVDVLIDRILAALDLGTGARAALLVNGLGATPPMELAIVARRALSALRGRGVTVERAWAGSFLTALDMAGCSVSVLAADDAVLAGLDAPASAPAWPGGGRAAPERVTVRGPAAAAPAVSGPACAAAPRFRAALAAVAAALRADEARLADLDGRAGDGDLGASMVRAADAIEGLMDSAWTSPAAVLAGLGDALRRAIGGSSGPFYATALLRASRRLGAEPDLAAWAAAFEEAVAAIADLGGARPGDRTMLDALHPAAGAFRAAVAAGRNAGDALAAAAEAAEAGAAATAGMTPRLGRASYLGERAIGVPDAGASAVATWLRALAGV
ncbi:dihydroxyacetone kinase family protein [Methylobacterium oryzihabitans]|uniref:Dihydroxyacetone kinase subunit DhaK n=1 Tax=Methylobacterium oryzihabitans TaxID=2499852 RepID=A0A437NVD7_9HYPH|nr:dihydroxyacetone kinase family protein [Methylobacterium oryzihabitans]RVU13975.1 dihydroxyacetone kinase subunit DhaK [Methylobacterium oryzihabitans]